MLTVEAISIRLFEFLPNKDALSRSEEVRERFFRENGLLSVEGGVPFLAGLLDGDGSCVVSVGRRHFFREVIVSDWRFSQDNDLYLVDYARRFVESLAPGSVRLKRRRGRRTLTACIRRSGIVALLDARIAHHSWKVVRWLQTIAEARSERSQFLSVGEAAGLLHVPYGVVARWVSSGRVRFVQGGRWRYIPATEIERLKREFGKSADC
jgi:excisionase family DNA binding protein